MERTHKVLFRLSWLTIGWVAASLGAASVHGEAPTTLEAVTKVWKDRQDRIGSVRIEWTERETTPKGYLTRYLDAAGFGPAKLEEMGIRPGTEVPPQDMTYDVASSVCIDGDKVRFQRDDRQWSGKENTFVILPTVSVFDGKLGKTLYARSAPDSPWPQAHIQQGHTGWIDGPYLYSVVLAYRPFLRRVSPIDPDALTSTGRKALIEGRPCLELERQQGRDLVQRVWIDPAIDYAPVRWIALVQERVTFKLDIGYRKGPAGEWLLEKWDRTTFERDGKVQRACRARVASCVINLPVQPTEFDLELPPGTLVSDSSSPSAPQQFIMKEGGRKRMIEPDEVGASYEQLVNTDSGQALGKKTWSFLSWPVIVIAVLGIMAGAWLAWRRVTSQKRPG